LRHAVKMHEGFMSTTVILYPVDSGIAMTRQVDPTISLLELARGTTPAGVPFILVNEEDLPDFEYFNAWTADFSEPNGYGIGLEAWQQEKENAAIVDDTAASAAVLAAAAENVKKYNEAVGMLNSAFQLPEAK